MARNRRKFSPEFKEEAAKMVVETSQTVAHVARVLDVNETTLGNWVKDYRESTRTTSPRSRYRNVRGCVSSSGRTAS